MSENTQTPAVRELVPYIFTNDKSAEGRLMPYLDMLYSGALNNMIGVMEALNSETNETELLLVGVQPSVDGMDGHPVFPLAKILNVESARKYKSPDGKGGWIEPTEEEGTSE